MRLFQKWNSGNKKVRFKNLEKDNKLWIKADKSNNFYKLSIEEYEKLKMKEVNKEYRKAGSDIVDSINQEHKTIASNLELSDRIFKTAEREAFCTLKDHKDNFQNNP